MNLTEQAIENRLKNAGSGGGASVDFGIGYATEAIVIDAGSYEKSSNLSIDAPLIDGKTTIQPIAIYVTDTENENPLYYVTADADRFGTNESILVNYKVTRADESDTTDAIACNLLIAVAYKEE